MGTGVRDFGIYQLGKEVTKGTPVAATTRWVGTCTPDPILDVFQSQGQIGVLLENPMSSDVVAKKGSDLTFEADLTYEQILHICSMSLKGNVTPTGAGADKTWTFNPTFTADPALDSFTFQRRISDGGTNWDQRIPYVMAREFEISGNIGENAKIMAECFGKQAELAQAITPAIAVPSVNFVAASDFKVYINDSFATIGTTQVDGSLLSFRLRVRTMARDKRYLGDTDMRTHSLKRAGFDLTLEAEYDATINAERTKARDRSLRYIRLEAVGPVLGASNYKITIDLAARYASDFDADDENEGNDKATLEFVQAYDAVAPLAAKIVVINSLAALP